MFNYFLAICLSVRPSFRRTVRPSIHVPMSLQPRGHRTRFGRFWKLYNLGSSSGIWKRLVTRPLPTQDYINTETLQTCVHTPNFVQIHPRNIHGVEDGRRIRRSGNSGSYVYVRKNHTDNKFDHLKPTVHVMNQQFNIQQLYALPTLYLRVLYLSENKQRLVPLTA